MSVHYDNSGKCVTRATEDDYARARALGNRYDPDLYGRFPWDSADYGDSSTQRRLNLSKASLGAFVEAVLRHKGAITCIHAMAPQYPRSYVQMRVFMTVDAKEAFEAETGFKLSCPPTVKLNSSVDD